MLLKVISKDSPGGLVAKTPRSQCGALVLSLIRELDLACYN